MCKGFTDRLPASLFGLSPITDGSTAFTFYIAAASRPCCILLLQSRHILFAYTRGGSVGYASWLLPGQCMPVPGQRLAQQCQGWWLQAGARPESISCTMARQELSGAVCLPDGPQRRVMVRDERADPSPSGGWEAHTYTSKSSAMCPVVW